VEGCGVAKGRVCVGGRGVGGFRKNPVAVESRARMEPPRACWMGQRTRVHQQQVLVLLRRGCDRCLEARRELVVHGGALAVQASHLARGRVCQ
jgi:hypothetical protein